MSYKKNYNDDDRLFLNYIKTGRMDFPLSPRAFYKKDDINPSLSEKTSQNENSSNLKDSPNSGGLDHQKKDENTFTFENWFDYVDDNFVSDKDQFHQNQAQSRQKDFSKKQKSSTKKDIPTIDVHGYTKEDALRACKDFIYNNTQAGVKKVRIIHGKGLSMGKKSIVRSTIREWLLHQQKNKSYIADFSYEVPKNGGHGATVIWLLR